MSTGKNINFDIRISGSVSFELPEAALEKIADDLENLFREHEAKNGVKSGEIPHLPVGTKLDVRPQDENPLSWMDDPDFGANLGRKTAAQHADAARHQVIRHRILREAGPTAADPFGLGRDASRRLSEIIADVVGTPKTRNIR